MTKTPPQEFFENCAEQYDALVNWTRRLANETPFYRRLFDEVGVKRVLDVACGTGRHAALFNRWGLEVEGADISENMIAHCRSLHGETDDLRWVVRSFDEPPPNREEYDAAICVGNSLAIEDRKEKADQVVQAMLEALRPGGVCVVQVLNLFRLPEGQTLWQQCKRLRFVDDDRLLLKCLHRVGDRGFIDFVEVRMDDDQLESRFGSEQIVGLEADDMLEAARKAGGCSPQLLGGYHEEPFDRSTSQDLILVCRKA